jgi:ketosteroid isomerase-like protein
VAGRALATFVCGTPVMFDLPPPLQCKGIEPHEQTWDLLFRYHKPGTAFDIQEFSVTAGQDVAFAVVIMRCGPNSSSNPADKDGFLFRLTIGLRKIDDDWRIREPLELQLAPLGRRALRRLRRTLVRASWT